ncbi:hypothetical protein H6G89_14220 [Oscillatoria sp. FACHB-1407]|uniref:hypothetical protein n=1 Tax=Oscillatoria sp. FACHB-1407 TaxID=2692847 RepID=UPI00168460B7|nr:hypothetical protein [Oscillatoria sp. FACHB-1407]MBD2462200.1 hypothetical protein [Oscillatoria sp. FACHB-1407]
MEFFLLAVSLFLTLLFVDFISVVQHVLSWFSLPGWGNLAIILALFAWLIADE